jgi:hypothetical protein
MVWGRIAFSIPTRHESRAQNLINHFCARDELPSQDLWISFARKKKAPRSAENATDLRCLIRLFRIHCRLRKFSFIAKSIETRRTTKHFPIV